MIRVLRTTHRLTMLALAVALPSLLILAVARRPEVPPRTSTGDRLSRAAGFIEPPGSSAHVVPTPAGDLEIGFVRDAGGETGLTLRPRRVLLAPDVLVYWVPAGQEGPPGEGSYLLGSLSGTSARRLRLPPAVRAGEGELVLFGLARGEVIARFPVARALGEGG